MESIAFSPTIDLPLTLVTVVAFLVNFHLWAHGDRDETSVDLKSRLNRANIRVILFFVALVTVCYFANLAVWSILVLVFAAGVVAAVASGLEFAPELMLLLTAGALRECCFGFPTLILNPPNQSKTSIDSECELIGQQGVAASPLRPSGDILIDGKELSAISDDGRLIETGTNVVVAGRRNGRVYVRATSPDPDESSSKET